MRIWYPVKRKACLSFLTRLSGLVCSVNTVNRYSITYGKLGKVTLMAFSNFLALYCKFLMVTYKILNNYS
ncbi:hypothetical protein TYRP_003188 [Tyrophagus putrescentiae]|nr:hypothetical protein TYRP_003188 [Tyrophagus putrescentiae]